METELIRSFGTMHEGPFQLDPVEIDEGRFWSFEEIEAEASKELFTPQLCNEFPRMREWWKNVAARVSAWPD